MAKKKKDTRGTTFLITFVVAVILIGVLSFIQVPYNTIELITTQEEVTEEVPYIVEELREVEEIYYDQKPVTYEECSEKEFEYEIIHPGNMHHEGLVTGYIKKEDVYSGLQYIDWRYWTGYYKTGTNSGKYYQSAIFCNLEEVPMHAELSACYYYDGDLVECPYQYTRDLPRRFCEVFTGLVWISAYDEKRDIRLVPTSIPTHKVCEVVTKMVNHGSPKVRTVTKIIPITKYKEETKIITTTEEVEVVKYRSLLEKLFNKA